MDQPPRDWRILDEPEQPGSPARPSAPNPRWRLLLAGTAALLASSVAATFWLAGTAGSAREVALDVSSSPVASSQPPGQLVVDVAGGVTRPGLYRLPAGSRVADAIAAAGGFGPSVDVAAASAALNLASLLQDGAKIQVPQRRATAEGRKASAPVADRSPPRTVDLNTATQTELESLPGIGPVTARKIIDARSDAPFASVGELTARKLVGASTFDKIRNLVSVGA